MLHHNNPYLDDEFYPLVLWNTASILDAGEININPNNGASTTDLQLGFIWNKGGWVNPFVDYGASGYAGIEVGEEHMFAGTFFTTGSLSGGSYICSFSSSLDGLASGGETWFRNTTGQGDNEFAVGSRYASGYDGWFFTGYIKQLLVYSGSLSDTDISNLYSEWQNRTF